eukprot:7689848-Pyramimonas_sp.AAC.1
MHSRARDAESWYVPGGYHCSCTTVVMQSGCAYRCTVCLWAAGQSDCGAACPLVVLHSRDAGGL